MLAMTPKLEVSYNKKERYVDESKIWMVGFQEFVLLEFS
jgi:hypothetical protein